jgi:hypothetical protein
MTGSRNVVDRSPFSMVPRIHRALRRTASLMRSPAKRRVLGASGPPARLARGRAQAVPPPWAS